MTNPYVPDEVALAPGDLARSDDVNSRYESTVAAFDKLPTPAVGKRGFGEPVPVGDPTDADHAATKGYIEDTWLTLADKAQLNLLNTTNLNSVAGSLASVNTVAANIADVNLAATNMPAILAAPTEAANAAESAAEAAASVAYVVKAFDTKDDLAASSLVAGLFAQTKGYTTVGDGGGEIYLIKTSADYGGTPDEYNDHTLANGNVAALQITGAVGTVTVATKKATTDQALISAASDFDRDLFVGETRNICAYSEALESANYAVVNATKSAADADSFVWQGIKLSKFSASNFYSTLRTQLGGLGYQLEPGAQYLYSFYVMALGETDQFIWLRNLASGGDYGHGAKLVNNQVRRVWGHAVAVTATTVDLISDPTIAQGSGTAGDLYWVALNKSEAIDLRVGGFQLEKVTTQKQGVAVIGDSVTAGSSGKVDLVSSSEWTRYAEGVLNIPFFNRAVGGETSASMLARWGADMTPLAVNATHAVISAGINDISQGVPLATMQANITAMVAAANADGMQPVVCTATPFAACETDAAKEADRQSLNTWIKSTFPLVIDFAAVVTDPVSSNQLNRLDTWYGDGTHMLGAAKREMGLYVASLNFWNVLRPSDYQPVAGAVGTRPTIGSSAGSYSDTLGAIDIAGGGVVTHYKNAATRSKILLFSGILTAVRTVYIRADLPKAWLVVNTATGFNVALGGTDGAGAAMGSTVTLAEGETAIIVTHGTGLIKGAFV